MIKNFNELTFTDDFMFCRILENNAVITKQLAELILGKNISRIENLKAQQELNDLSDAKGVRFDVYFEDDENNVYDVEIQTYNDGNLAKRSHYYHSLIAVDNLNKGETYRNLKNSYVIFICTFDPFKDGLPVYTVHSRVDENLDRMIEDGITTVLLNCTSRSEDISSELLAFFKYVTENSPSEGLTNSIEDDLVLAKEHKIWRKYYMDLCQMKERERAEVRAEDLISSVESLVANMDLSVEEACLALNHSCKEYEDAKEFVKTIN